MSYFDDAFEHALGNEGGYVNHPNDPGGETKWGISKRSYPRLDIRSLTIHQAKDIYRCDWWDRYDMGSIRNKELAIKFFDTAINMGFRQASLILQRSINDVADKSLVVAVDGWAGAQTYNSLNYQDAAAVLQRFRRRQAGFYQRLASRQPKFRSFLKGWLRRANA